MSSGTRSGVSGCSKSTSVATVEATVDAVCVLVWHLSEVDDFDRSWLKAFVVG